MGFPSRRIVFLFLFILYVISNSPLFSKPDKIGQVIAEMEDLQKSGKYASTVSTLEKINKIRPYHDRVSILYGIALLYREDSVSEDEYLEGCRISARIFQHVIEMHQGMHARKFNNQLTLLHFYRALALWFSGQSEHAIAEFKISYDLNPSLKEALYNQSIIMLEQGKSAESRRIMEKYRRASDQKSGIE